MNIAFSRELLRMVMADVRKITTVVERKSVWVYKVGQGSWEFHGPNGFYWHGSADNAYDARAMGWSAWESKIEGDAEIKRQMDKVNRA